MKFTKEGIKKYSISGVNKAQMSVMQMFVMAVMAGMFLAFAGAASTVAAVSVGSASIAKFVSAIIFPAGLVMVMLNCTELFTGNSLMVISTLDQKIKSRHMVRNWLIVFGGNFVGSISTTGLLALGHVYSLFDNGFARSAINIAATKCELSFMDAFVRGILCNVLVCVAIMMAQMTDNVSGKVKVIFLPIFIFVICGFEHSIANMSFISGGIFAQMQYGNLGVDTSSLNVYNFLVGNLLPVTIGNIIGGVLIGIWYWYINKKHPED